MPSFDDTSLPRQRGDFVRTTSVNNGAVAAVSAGKVFAEEFGNHFSKQVLLSCVALPVVTGNTTGASFGSKLLYTFPEGRISIDNVNAYFGRITFNTEAGADGDIAAAGSGDYSLGTTATAEATLASTEVDLLPSTAMLDPFAAGVGRSNVWSTLAAAAIFDGTTTAVAMYLNVIIDDADVSDAAASDSVYFTGYIRCTYRWFGDNAA